MREKASNDERGRTKSDSKSASVASALSGLFAERRAKMIITMAKTEED